MNQSGSCLPQNHEAPLNPFKNESGFMPGGRASQHPLPLLPLDLHLPPPPPSPPPLLPSSKTAAWCHFWEPGLLFLHMHQAIRRQATKSAETAGLTPRREAGPLSLKMVMVEEEQEAATGAVREVIEADAGGSQKFMKHQAKNGWCFISK